MDGVTCLGVCSYCMSNKGSVELSLVQRYLWRTFQQNIFTICVLVAGAPLSQGLVLSWEVFAPIVTMAL